MGINGYEKHYLFRNGQECCKRYFPGVGGCPMEHDIQTGYYWETYQDDVSNLDKMPARYNHTFYPDLNSGTCING